METVKEEEYWREVIGWDGMGNPIVTKEGWYRIKASRDAREQDERGPEETVIKRG